MARWKEELSEAPGRDARMLKNEPRMQGPWQPLSSHGPCYVGVEHSQQKCRLKTQGIQ